MSWGVATQNGVSVSLASIVSLSCGATEFSPAFLFPGGVQGAWYDPSDYSTLFQDSAGTTPVTAVEQSVRLMRDKSGNGNHATAPSDASRPVLRARYNQITYSEQFDNAAWIKSQATAANTLATVAPNGTNTADTLLDTVFLSSHYAYQTLSTLPASGSTVTVPVYAKAATLTYVTVGITDISSGSLYAVAVFNLSDGTLATSGSAGAGYSVTSTNVSAVGDGWYRCSVTCVVGTSASFVRAAVGVNKTGIISAASGGMQSYLGDGSGIYVWGADFRTGSSAGTYQRIAAATDYDTVGFLPYLNFITDDSFGTNSIDFTATNKMFVCAGITKNSDAANAIVYELSADLNSNNGSTYLFAPIVSGGLNTYYVASKGTVPAAAGTGTGVYVAPITNVVSTVADISTPSLALRANGSQVATSTATQGTGNYGNYPLYIGRRNNASLPFNGRIYQMVVCGKALNSSELASTEAYVNSKTGAY